MYAKTIKSGKQIEFYQYEGDPRPISERARTLQTINRNKSLALHRENEVEFRKSYTGRRKDLVRRSQMAFTRLIIANLGESKNPIFASLTYATHIEDPRQGHKDFGSFARNIRSTFGKHVRYIAVSEFQKSGRLHLHALIWGLPAWVVARERDTRLVASLWNKGFVDLRDTDGKHELAGYMAKYMGKNFIDPRLFGIKTYVASRNIKRPEINKRAIVISHIYENELSTVEPILDKTYLTQWLGACRYRLFKLS